MLYSPLFQLLFCFCFFLCVTSFPYSTLFLSSFLSFSRCFMDTSFFLSYFRPSMNDFEDTVGEEVCQIFIVYSLYKNGQDSLDIQYISLLTLTSSGWMYMRLCSSHSDRNRFPNSGLISLNISFNQISQALIEYNTFILWLWHSKSKGFCNKYLQFSLYRKFQMIEINIFRLSRKKVSESRNQRDIITGLIFFSLYLVVTVFKQLKKFEIFQIHSYFVQ